MSKSSACPECRHILTSGRKCRAVALRGRPFCFKHSRQRSIAADGSCKSVKLPPLEDHASILLSLNQIIRAMTTGRLDHKAAGRCLYAIQLARQTIRQLEAEPPFEQVTDYLDGRFGDTIAVTDEPRTPEDLYYLLSEYEKSHCNYGDKGWEPSNADYEPEFRQPESPEPKSDDLKSEQSENNAAPDPVSIPPQLSEPSPARPAAESSPTSPGTPAAESAPSSLEPRATDPTGNPAPTTQKPDAADPADKSTPTPAEQGASLLTTKSRPIIMSYEANPDPGMSHETMSHETNLGPGGTPENSPGRKSRVADSTKSEVLEGRPKPAPQPMLSS